MTAKKPAAPLRSVWGPWEFCPELCLNNVPMEYPIFFEDIKDTGDILFWMCHMSGKDSDVYGGPEQTCYLARAFKEIFWYSGIDIYENSTFSGEKVAKKYLRGLAPRREVSLRTRHIVLERDNFRCRDCGASSQTGSILEIDHIVPVALGGTNDIDNLQTLCFECNRGKSDRLVAYRIDRTEGA